MATNYTDIGIDPETGLTLRERSFVDHLMTDPNHNQTRAYNQAGYEAGTIEQARKDAHSLINKPDVQAFYMVQLVLRAARVRVSSDRVLLELAAVCYAKRTDFTFDPQTGAIGVKPGVPEEYLSAIESTRVTKKVFHTAAAGPDRPATTETTFVAEFKLHSKLKAAELLCKHLGLITNELPDLEVLLNRLTPKTAALLRKMLSQTPVPIAPPQPLGIPQ